MKSLNIYNPSRTLALSIILCLSSIVCSAQSWAWAQGEGDIGNDVSNAVATDTYGNTYITGNIAGKANFSGTVYQGNGIYEVFIAKYDPTGNLVWAKLAGGKGNDQGNSIKWSNGFLYVGGSFSDTAFFESTALISKGETDAFVAKYNDNGNLIWVKSAGGTGTDYTSAIDVDYNGNIFVAGSYEQSIHFGTTNLTTPNFYTESFYAKYDGSGNVTWAKSTTGNNANLITGIAFDNNNAVYITGFYGESFTVGNETVTAVSSSNDIFLCKIHDNGNFEWLKRAGGTYEDGAHAVCCDKNGNPSITGYFAGVAYFDSNAVTYSDYNDVFVARYDTAGNNLWVRAGRGNKLDVGFSIACDVDGNVVATGMFQNIIDFDGNILTTHDILDRDIFLVSYDKNGNIRWITRAGGLDTDCGLGVAVHTNGNIALSGYYLHICSFGNLTIDYADGNDLFVAEYNAPVVNGVKKINDDWNVSVYPNPTSSIFNLQSSIFNSDKIRIEVYNNIGEKQHTAYCIQVTGYCQLSTANWSSGIYFVQISSADKTKTLKLIKQ